MYQELNPILDKYVVDKVTNQLKEPNATLVLVPVSESQIDGNKRPELFSILKSYVMLKVDLIVQLHVKSLSENLEYATKIDVHIVGDTFDVLDIQKNWKL